MKNLVDSTFFFISMYSSVEVFDEQAAKEEKLRRLKVRRVRQERQELKKRGKRKMYGYLTHSWYLFQPALLSQEANSCTKGQETVVPPTGTGSTNNNQSNKNQRQLNPDSLHRTKIVGTRELRAKIGTKTLQALATEEGRRMARVNENNETMAHQIKEKEEEKEIEALNQEVQELGDAEATGQEQLAASLGEIFRGLNPFGSSDSLELESDREEHADADADGDEDGDEDDNDNGGYHGNEGADGGEFGLSIEDEEGEEVDEDEEERGRGEIEEEGENGENGLRKENGEGCGDAQHQSEGQEGGEGFGVESEEEKETEDADETEETSLSSWALSDDMFRLGLFLINERSSIILKFMDIISVRFLCRAGVARMRRTWLSSPD